MKSFRGAVSHASSHSGIGFPASMSSISKRLLCPMSRPIYMSRLIRNLNPETKIFNTWNFDGGHISASTQVGLNSDGTGSFRGHVHDSGPTGYDYVATTVLLDVRDQQGNTLVFAHKGHVHGTFDIGSRDDDWQDDSFNCAIAANWDAVQTSRTWSNLHTSIDPLDVLEHVLLGVLIGLAIDAFVLFGYGVATGRIICHWIPERGALRCEW